MRKTRKTLSVLHLTENIPKTKKNSLCCIWTKPYKNFKFKKKLLFHFKNQENNLCIAFHSKHTKTRKKLSRLHLTQTIHKLKIKKKNYYFMGKTRKLISALHFTQYIQKPEKRLSVLQLKKTIHKLKI